DPTERRELPADMAAIDRRADLNGQKGGRGAKDSADVARGRAVNVLCLHDQVEKLSGRGVGEGKSPVKSRRRPPQGYGVDFMVGAATTEKPGAHFVDVARCHVAEHHKRDVVDLSIVGRMRDFNRDVLTRP